MELRKLLTLAACVAVAGCYHPKGLDSYNTMFRETQATQTGDPYTFGGIGEASGGITPKQSSATDNKSADPREDTLTGRLGMIEPGMGSTTDTLGPASGPPQVKLPTGAAPAGQ